MLINQKHVLWGVAAYGAAMYAGYSWVKKQQKVVDITGECHGSCAFDRLAPIYDDIVDSEEAAMLYGWKRSSLLKHAQGDVLELSAGTGRNLPHFKYSNITSLTLTDVSTSMLQQAQRKYFEDLKLQYKQPDVRCRFLLADAQHLVAPPGEQPHTVLLPPFKETNKQAASGKQAEVKSKGLLRQRSRSNSSSSSSSSSSTDADQPSGSADAAANQTQKSASTSAATPPAAAISSSSSSTDSPSSSSATGTKRAWAWSKRLAATAEQDSAAASSSSSSSSSTFAPHSFDTVVDTFGLCSCADPVGVLRQAALLVKPGGKVLLLEHGQGTWDWINNKINESAARHYKTYGCWYNRDILGIVQEAGLQVESVSRPWLHFGTTYIIVASPQPEPATVATAA